MWVRGRRACGVDVGAGWVYGCGVGFGVGSGQYRCGVGPGRNSCRDPPAEEASGYHPYSQLPSFHEPLLLGMQQIVDWPVQLAARGGDDLGRRFYFGGALWLRACVQGKEAGQCR